MSLHPRVLLCVTLLVYVAHSQDGDGFTDENRPYKFGFNIEGYQHRFEEKNEKGIIMGEYGFITGDGVYHLTVYATDENGNFKIVRTKNIYIGLPGEKTTTPVPAVSSLRPERVQQITDKPVLQQGVAGCGGCVIPSTTSAPQAGVSGSVEAIRGNAPGGPPPGRVAGTAGGPVNPLAGGIPSPGGAANYPGSDPTPNQLGRQPSTPYQDSHQQSLIRPNQGVGGRETEFGQGLVPSRGSNVPTSQVDLSNGRNDPKIQEMVSNLPKMTDSIKSMEDLQALFYMFNYTLTYHGHNEVGNRAGDKNGSYFFNGRDGFGRNVSYIANEFGYQPNITLHDLSPEETPREDTEKDLTKLLGNEFRWFYGKG